MKLQSALEYIMTYGWAILIIAIVIVAMFELNLFNPNTYSPKAAPGACSVTRNKFGASLSGTCINLEPNFVAQFNGASSKISLASIVTFHGNNGPFTISLWFQAFSLGAETVWMSDEIYATSGFRMGDCGFWTIESGGTLQVWCTTPSLNTWHNMVVTYNNPSGVLYLDGVNVGSSTGSYIGNSQNLLIGTGGGWYFNGQISNVQIYNTTLSTNSIQALYLEGIGSAPINVRNLVGWWPLNDNSNDYSGNGNNGVATSVFYTTNWGNGYTQP